MGPVTTGEDGKKEGADQSTGEQEPAVHLRFQVAEVKSPLMAVHRITEQGNRVVFDESDENYIENIKTGERLRMW